MVGLCTVHKSDGEGVQWRPEFFLVYPSWISNGWSRRYQPCSLAIYYSRWNPIPSDQRSQDIWTGTLRPTKLYTVFFCKKNDERIYTSRLVDLIWSIVLSSRCHMTCLRIGKPKMPELQWRALRRGAIYQLDGNCLNLNGGGYRARWGWEVSHRQGGMVLCKWIRPVQSSGVCALPVWCGAQSARINRYVRSRGGNKLYHVPNH
jgi:hypothetical protein